MITVRSRATGDSSESGCKETKHIKCTDLCFRGYKVKITKQVQHNLIFVALTVNYTGNGKHFIHYLYIAENCDLHDSNPQSSNFNKTILFGCKNKSESI